MAANMPVDDDITVSGLYVYPVKSCRGIRVKSAAVSELGLELDRFWIISSPDRQQVTQRGISKMSMILPRLEIGEGEDCVVAEALTSPPGKDGNDIPPSALPSIPSDAYGRGGRLILNAPNMPPLVIPFRPRAELTKNSGESRITVWTWDVAGVDEGEEAAAWLQDFLGVPARLWVKANTVRDLPVNHTPARALFSHEPQTAFADVFPFLMLSEASVADIESRIKQRNAEIYKDNPITHVSVINFRPNIVISSPQMKPWAEDDFLQISINHTHDMYIASRCTRCVMPTNNPFTGIFHKNEPTATLMTFRRVDAGAKYKACVGMNVVAATHGWTLSVGDTLQVRSQQAGIHHQDGIWNGKDVPDPVIKRDANGDEAPPPPSPSPKQPTAFTVIWVASAVMAIILPPLFAQWVEHYDVI
ncbi:MOSC N-terminal beta barrel domain-containing protein [Fimicolochytrium jonesii]|uniref:MOSC N-terminal beta barrel domain-containing protein n=1 Tax=Fimicolochytrium jonesii TaxID=1396493 RepID=UPI0022FF00AC|nr:MOSC N-terminal beta barrel domain-containing protein [Fimicolochytrium jonesii]KAI8824506.1 MOSC N-terminal beta barrel domain-containing protein [Fimicolochytrium jonesii]